MAITLTERFRGALGGRKIRGYETTWDGTLVSISAASVDLTRIEFHIWSLNTGHSTTLSFIGFSIGANGLNVVATLSIEANDITSNLFIGW